MAAVMPVQCTNDSSIVSKLSMSDAGYLKDHYLQHFVSKPARRTALINRGYYIRMRAIDHVVVSFLQVNVRNSQIVSFGAGFDTTYWRLWSKGLTTTCKYFEIDFPSVMHRKVAILKSNVQLIAATGELISKDNDSVDSEHYCLIGCDVTDLERMEKLLLKCGLDFKCPTLLLSECVLTYIQPEKVNALIRWCAHSFQSALFCAYEQIVPDDGFGLVMQRHFQSLNSPLLNINDYPTRPSQIQRYLSQNWQRCVCCTMSDFYNCLPNDEKMRIDAIELFDEFEEWHLKCNHYTVLCASVGSCNENLLPNSDEPLAVPVCIGRLKTCCLPFANDSVNFERYSHSSVKLANGDMIAVGGFGCTRECRAHQRLADVLLIQANATDGVGFRCTTIDTTGNKPGGVMHHKLVLLRDGSILLYGGRASPAAALDHSFLLKFSNGCGLWEHVVFHPTSDKPQALWRHSVTTAIDSNGSECVIIVGGCSSSCNALVDCYILNVTSWKLKKLCIELPEGRHSHCALSYRGGVLVFGGLSSDAVPLCSCLHICFCQEKGWKLSQIHLKPPLPKRFSMTGVLIGEVAWLIGGVSFNQRAELLAVNISESTWTEYTIKELTGVILHGITAHCVDETAQQSSQILILGGGGNCFSFGTHFNQSLILLQLP